MSISTREMVAELCGRHGITLALDTPLVTEQLGDAFYAYVGGGDTYSLIARHDDVGVILYASPDLVPA